MMLPSHNCEVSILLVIVKSHKSQLLRILVIKIKASPSLVMSGGDILMDYATNIMRYFICDICDTVFFARTPSRAR